MVVIRILFLVLFFCLNFSVVQSQEMLWNIDYKLTWADFNAEPDLGHPFAAITYSGMSYSFSADVINNQVKVNYEVNCFFVPNKSWVKSEYKSDVELLKHEQLHFDISELYARKFREQLSKMSFTENVKVEISDLYEKITKEKIELQNEYDIETDHSVNILKQKQWEQKILIELQKRASYASK
jgi:hypothetical protein